VGIWGKLLEGHPDAEAFIKAVPCMSTMVSEAMHRTPDVDRFKSAAKGYHKAMLTPFPKVALRIYEHALLCHVSDVLMEGSLLDESSWFLEAYYKVWKLQLLYQSNSGGGVNKDLKVAVHEKRSEKGLARLQAEQGAREDLTALKATCFSGVERYASVRTRVGDLSRIHVLK
jgi:hypothetical protein